MNGQTENIGGASLEIERKFLIDMPCLQDLLGAEGVSVSDILQTYLLPEKGETSDSRRIRRRVYADGHTVRTETKKSRLSDLTCVERERELTPAEYDALREQRDPARTEIEKKRYAIPFAGHILELDVYPFWKHTAVLEIELSDEKETFSLPPYLKVVRDVSADARFKNRSLAVHIPEEASLRPTSGR